MLACLLQATPQEHVPHGVHTGFTLGSVWCSEYLTLTLWSHKGVKACPKQCGYFEVFVFCFETGSHYISLAGLELPM